MAEKNRRTFIFITLSLIDAHLHSKNVVCATMTMYKRENKISFPIIACLAHKEVLMCSLVTI